MPFDLSCSHLQSSSSLSNAKAQQNKVRSSAVLVQWPLTWKSRVKSLQLCSLLLACVQSASQLGRQRRQLDLKQRHHSGSKGTDRQRGRYLSVSDSAFTAGCFAKRSGNVSKSITTSPQMPRTCTTMNIERLGSSWAQPEKAEIPADAAFWWSSEYRDVRKSATITWTRCQSCRDHLKQRCQVYV